MPQIILATKKVALAMAWTVAWQEGRPETGLFQLCGRGILILFSETTDSDKNVGLLLFQQFS